MKTICGSMMVVAKQCIDYFGFYQFERETCRFCGSRRYEIIVGPKDFCEMPRETLYF
jgi:hypothetical protein